MLLCVFWATATAASSSLGSPGQSIVTATSSQPTFARPSISAPGTDLSERTDNDTQICGPNGTNWYSMVYAYAEPNRQSLNASLIETLKESGMTLTGNLSLASSPYDPNRVFCDIFPKASDNSGTSFPKCLLETAIDDFCTVNQNTPINENLPFFTSSKGGLWKTYKFTGYSISGLYVALEINRTPECKGHRRTLYPYDNTPDIRCKDKLLGEIVNRCTSLPHLSMLLLHICNF